jgi:HNH endonuclease
MCQSGHMRQKIPVERESEVVERYQAGESSRQLGGVFGCCDQSVRRVLKKNGIQLRPPGCSSSFGPDRLNQMLRKYREGSTTTELAALFGCSRKYLHKFLRAEGISTRKAKIPQSKRGALVALYEKGASLNELADRYNCTQRTVTKALREAGARIRGQGGSPSPLDPQLVKDTLTLKQDGLTQTAIAGRLGCSVNVVGRVLVDHGLTAKPQGPDHPLWKGGVAKTEDGYILVAMSVGHPFAPQMRRSNGYCLEHRLVMAEHLGRPLRRSETVHHLNGVKMDNRIENLQMRQGKHGKHECFRCQDCGSLNVTPVEL